MARALVYGALAVVMSAAAAPAQQVVDSGSTAAQAIDGRLRAEIFFLRGFMRALRVPPADSFRLGHQEIAAGTTHAGTAATARGNLQVRGRVTGDAIALHGDVIVHPGGSVGRNAIAVDGRVRTLGGIVEGDVRTVRGLTASILARAGRESPSAEPVTTWAAIKLVIGWFAILLAMGIGVLLFAERNLDGVVSALEQHFARSFWTGVLTQVAAIPALLLLLVGLAISVIGILLVPFAVFAFVIALSGLMSLGFIAVARFTGRAFFRAGGEARMVKLRSLSIGLTIYLGLWLVAALFISSPVVGSILRAVALAGTWVALTFGLGATMLSRAGTQRDAASRRPPKVVDDLSWQTPTPVTGVAAARRPVAAVKER